MLNAGADKVSINTAAVFNPEFVREAAERFGSQCIVVAMDAKTGAYKWHFQSIHHDIWDMDNVMAPVLLDLTIGGKHGSKRMGQDHVVGLNPWSHRGVPFNGMTVEQCEDLFGPSYARTPRAFRELYPDHVLVEATNRALAAYFGEVA